VSDLTLYEATEKAIAAAKHLEDDRFLGSKAALLVLARKIDAWDVIVKWAVEDRDRDAKGGRPTVPQNDNVSISAYAKLSEQMGLTPTGQKALEQIPRTASAPERVTPKGDDPDGGTADEDGGKAARIAASRAGRSVPGAG
jgi:hypothetical protein